MMFSNLWAKTTALFGVIIAGLLTFIKFRSSKIERLKQENELNDKLKEIRETQEEAAIGAAKKERKKIEKKVEDVKKKTKSKFSNDGKRDRLNKL